MTQYAAMWQDAEEFVSMFGMAQTAEARQQEPDPEPEPEPEFDGIEAITMSYQR